MKNIPNSMQVLSLTTPYVECLLYKDTHNSIENEKTALAKNIFQWFSKSGSFTWKRRG